MVHAGVFPSLEEKVSSKENPFPRFTTAAKEFLLDIVAPARPAKMLGVYQATGKFIEAADCAVRLGKYGLAFTLYNQAIAQGTRRANFLAAELAESLVDYELGLQYRLQVEDFALAGMDAARLGRQEQANEYWAKLREA